VFLTLVIMIFNVHITAVTTRTDSPNIHHPYSDISWYPWQQWFVHCFSL